jgi:hypothetical protein
MSIGLGVPNCGFSTQISAYIKSFQVAFKPFVTEVPMFESAEPKAAL